MRVLAPRRGEPCSKPIRHKHATPSHAHTGVVDGCQSPICFEFFSFGRPWTSLETTRITQALLHTVTNTPRLGAFVLQAGNSPAPQETASQSRTITCIDGIFMSQRRLPGGCLPLALRRNPHKQTFFMISLTRSPRRQCLSPRLPMPDSLVTVLRPRTGSPGGCPETRWHRRR